MSVSGIKLLAETTLGFDSSNNPAYITTYKCTTPVTVPSGGQHFGGGIVTILNGLIESTFNSTVAQAVADECNLQTSNVESFTANDVFGGRI